jgi:hypothetical protein
VSLGSLDPAVGPGATAIDIELPPIAEGLGSRIALPDDLSKDLTVFYEPVHVPVRLTIQSMFCPVICSVSMRIVSYNKFIAIPAQNVTGMVATGLVFTSGRSRGQQMVNGGDGIG